MSTGKATDSINSTKAPTSSASSAVPPTVFDDSWKAKVTGGTHDANSSINDIASSIKLQHPIRWQTAEGEQYQLNIPKYDIDSSKPPK
jgi:hypothetical protein